MDFNFKVAQHPVEVRQYSFSGKIVTDQGMSEAVDAIQEALELDFRKFVFEMKDLSHINSQGLNLFLRLFSKIRAKGGDLVFADVSDGVAKLLEISKLDTIFTICSSIEEGLNILNAQEA